MFKGLNVNPKENKGDTTRYQCEVTEITCKQEISLLPYSCRAIHHL